MLEIIEDCLVHLKHSVKKYSTIVLILILILVCISNRANAENVTVNVNEEKIVSRYQVAKFNFVEVSGVYSITLWILLGSLAKIGMN